MQITENFGAMLQGKNSILELGQTCRIMGGVALNGDPTIRCQSVVISFLRGDEAGDMFAQDMPFNCKVETKGWTAQNVLKDIDAVRGVQEVTISYNDPAGSDLASSLCFWIEGTINNTFGLSKAQVTIEYTDEEGETHYEDKFFYLRKDTGEPFIRNFTTYRTTIVTTPCLYFERDEEINFSWESYGGYYELYKGNDTTPFYGGWDCKFTLEEGLTKDMNFILKGTWGGNQVSETEELTAGEQVVYQVISIQIKNPKYRGAWMDFAKLSRGDTKTFLFNMDGIVIGSVDSLSYEYPLGKKCFLGANLYADESLKDVKMFFSKAVSIETYRELVIPIATGQYLEIYVDSDYDPSVTWYFIPFGNLVDTPYEEDNSKKANKNVIK